MKKLIFFLIAFILFTNVNAMSFDITASTKINNSYIPDWFTIYSSGRSLNYRYDDHQYYSQMSETGYSSYGYLYFCGVNLGSAVSLPNCNTGCFNSSINLVELGGSCTITASNVNYSGSYYFLFYSIDSWAWDETHTTPYVNDNITFYPKNSSITSIVGFMTNTLTDTDYYITYASNNRLNELQQDTIDKLESIESSINNQTNSINNQTNAINNQTNSINNIDNTINDSNVSNPSSYISSFSSFLASNSTITNLLTLPISLFQKVLSSLNANCSSYDLGELLGTHIILPCVVISDYIGTSLWNVIDVLISGMFVYHISRKFIKVFDSMSSMKDGDVIND